MKSTKKILVVLLALVMVLSLAACGDSGKKEEGNKAEGGETAKPKKIGLLIYNGGDNYIATVRQAFEKMDKENDAYELEIVDGQKKPSYSK